MKNDETLAMESKRTDERSRKAAALYLHQLACEVLRSEVAAFDVKWEGETGALRIVRDPRF